MPRAWAQRIDQLATPAAGRDQLGRASAAAAGANSVRDIMGRVGRILPGDRYSTRATGPVQPAEKPKVANFGAFEPNQNFGTSFAYPNTAGHVATPEGFSGGSVLDVIAANTGTGRM